MVERSTVDPLHRQSGKLGSSWLFFTEGATLSTLRGTLGSSAYYSPIHELGGVQTPKNAQWFWIPTARNRGPNGQPLISPTKARNLIASGEWRYAKIQGGRVGVTDELFKLMFLLATKARYPARLGFIDKGTGKYEPQYITDLGARLLATMDFQTFLQSKIITP
jgi:hypothetical protein